MIYKNKIGSFRGLRGDQRDIRNWDGRTAVFWGVCEVIGLIALLLGYVLDSKPLLWISAAWVIGSCIFFIWSLYNQHG